jgi:hypothetical protein
MSQLDMRGTKKIKIYRNYDRDHQKRGDWTGTTKKEGTRPGPLKKRGLNRD